MAVKWSAFSAGSTVTGSDILVGLQGGANVKWTYAQAAAYLGSRIVFDVTQYGWAADGTDHSTAAAAVLAAAAAAGGGTIYFPPSTGTYRADSQLLIPNDSGSPQAVQKNIAFLGAGGGANWYAGVGDPMASVLDLRYQGTGAKLTSLGLGALLISNLQFTDGGGSSKGTPFVLTTNTTLTCRQNSFVGTGAKTSTVTISIASPCVVSWTAHGLQANNVVYFTTSGGGALPTGITSGQLYYVSATGLATDTFEISVKSGSTPIVTTGSQSGTHTAHFGGMDAIMLGGVGGLGNTVASAFQGYGTVIDDNVFTKMNRGVVGLCVANSIIVTNNSFIQNTGTVAIESDGSPSADVGQATTGWVVAGNVIEMDVYKFGVKLSNTRNSTLGPNGFYDDVGATTSYYRFETSVTSPSSFLSVRNVIISQFNSGGTAPLVTQDGNAAQLAQLTIVGGDPSTTASTGKTGNFSSQVAFGLLVSGQRNTSNHYPGQFTIIDSGGSTDQFSVALDGSAGIAYLDAYNLDGVFPRRIIINPRGGAVGTGANVRVSKTTAYPVTVADSSTQFDNLGSSGTVNFTLPNDPAVTANVGAVIYGFCVAAAHTLQITCGNGAATIAVIGLGTTIAGGNITCATVGSYIELTNYDPANGRLWVAKSYTGTWSIN